MHLTSPADAGLKRTLGLGAATWASVASIIGSGWLFAALYAAESAGGAAFLAWIIAGLLVIVLAQVHAELGAMYPVTGGTVRYPHLAFGSVAGISFGFFSYIQSVAIAPIECFATMRYLSHFWTGVYASETANVTRAGFMLEIALMAILVAVNFLAARIVTRVNSIITLWKVAVPVVVGIVLLTKFHGANFTVGGSFMPGGIHALLGSLPAAGIIFALSGFEQANQLAGEIKNPGRNLPRAIIISVVLSTGIFCLVQIAFTGAMPASQLAHGFAGIANENILSAPLPATVGLLGLGSLASVLWVDAVISPAGTGLIYTTGTSRISYGLSGNGYLPRIFGQVDHEGVPWVGLIAAYIIGLFFLLPFPSWHTLVGLITGASVLMYAGAPLALGAFRRQVPEADRPYRLPNADVFAPVAFIIADLIIYWSGFEVVWKLGLVLLVGYVIIGAFMALDPRRPPLHWNSVPWLLTWLFGMGIISWQGQYGGGASVPPVNTSNIPFGWDFVVVAVFSLVIYYWAMATKLPRDEMLELVSDQSIEDSWS